MAVNIPTHPAKSENAVSGKNPWFWWGTADRDGDAADWLAAPLGSIYIYRNGSTSAKLYVKVAANDHDNDWADTTD